MYIELIHFIYVMKRIQTETKSKHEINFHNSMELRMGVFPSAFFLFESKMLWFRLNATVISPIAFFGVCVCVCVSVVYAILISQKVASEKFTT